MGNGLQVPTESGRFSILSAITCTYMFAENMFTIIYYLCMCFTRKGRHLARCSLRLATCKGFGIGRTRYVTNLIISSYTINFNDLLYFVSDITVVCVLSDEEDMWHDALSDSQLYWHRIW